LGVVWMWYSGVVEQGVGEKVKGRGRKSQS